MDPTPPVSDDAPADPGHEVATLKAAIDDGLADLAAGRVHAFELARITARGRQLRGGRTPSA